MSGTMKTVTAKSIAYRSSKFPPQKMRSENFRGFMPAVLLVYIFSSPVRSQLGKSAEMFVFSHFCGKLMENERLIIVILITGTQS